MGTSAPTPSLFGQYLHEARFQYSDCLDDQRIRLLELKFGHTDEVVCLHVQTYPVQNHPPYIALSYAWGDPNDTVNVLCNGKSIAVTRNLKEALWQFRENRKRLARLESSATSRGQLLHFWIDAICIDQECDKEKSFQVSMMANIYKQARHVFAWLGPADESSDVALRCINNVGKMAENCGLKHYTGIYPEIWRDMVFASRGVEQLRPIEPTICSTGRSLSTLSNMDLRDLFKAFSGWYSHTDLLPITELKDIFTRPWWTRLWVLQEITLSRSTYLVCGSRRIPKARYTAFLVMYASLQAIVFTACYRVDSLNAYQRDILDSSFHRRPLSLLQMPWFLHQRRTELAKLLRLTCIGIVYEYGRGYQSFEATRPEDKIFAILGLATDQDELKTYGVVPNYEIPYQQIYTITMSVLLQQGHMFLLSMCQAPRAPGLPSWVPDWSQSTGLTIQELREIPTSTRIAFRCFGDRTYRKSTIQVFNDHGTIRRISIKSYLYDEVHQIGCFTHQLDGEQPSLRQPLSWPIIWLLEVLRLSYCRRRDYKGFHNRLRASTRTCVAGARWNEDNFRIRVGNDFFSEAVLLLRPGIGILGKGRLKLDARRFLASQTGKTEISDFFNVYRTGLGRNIQRMSPGRLPFVTSKGHLGLSSQHVKKGDVIAIFEGSQVPFVLRRQKKGQFSLIGEAYVDGIMDGEVADTGEYRYVTLV